MFLLIDFDIAMVTLTHVKILWKELGLSSFIKIKQGGSREEDENVKKNYDEEVCGKNENIWFFENNIKYKMYSI